MKKHTNKPQVSVGENKRQATQLRSANAPCFIKYCLPSGFFSRCSRLIIFWYKQQQPLDNIYKLVGYSFPKLLPATFRTGNNQLSLLTVRQFSHIA